MNYTIENVLDHKFYMRKVQRNVIIKMFVQIPFLLKFISNIRIFNFTAKCGSTANNSSKGNIIIKWKFMI